MSRSTDPAVDQPVPAMRVGMVGKGSSEGRASEPTAVILASDLLTGRAHGVPACGRQG